MTCSYCNLSCPVPCWRHYPAPYPKVYSHPKFINLISANYIHPGFLDKISRSPFAKSCLCHLLILLTTLYFQDYWLIQAVFISYRSTERLLMVYLSLKYPLMALLYHLPKTNWPCTRLSKFSPGFLKETVQVISLTFRILHTRPCTPVPWFLS